MERLAYCGQGVGVGGTGFEPAVFHDCAIVGTDVFDFVAVDLADAIRGAKRGGEVQFYAVVGDMPGVLAVRHGHFEVLVGCFVVDGPYHVWSRFFRSLMARVPGLWWGIFSD